MKNIFYILLLLPTIIFAQYPSNSGQKITLGEQTTADGLVYRGVASIDTVSATSKITRANKQDTSAFLLLDTVTNLLWHYKTASNGWIQAGGGVSVSSFSAGTTGLTPSTATTGAVTLGGTLAVANGGTGSTTQNFVDLTTTQSIGGAKTFTNAVTMPTTSKIQGSVAPNFILASTSIVGSGVGPYQTFKTNNSDFGYIGSEDALMSTTGNKLALLGLNGLSFRTGASYTQRMTILNDGNVGIGTASPTVDLEIFKSVGQPQFVCYNGTNWIGLRGDEPLISRNSGKDLLFVTYATYPTTGVSIQMTLQSNGKLKIADLAGIDDVGADANGVLQAAISDMNLKNTIENSPFGLNEILLLKPVTFLYNDENRKIDSDVKEVGFIAQDVFDIIPNAVSSTGSGDLQLDYRAITATLVKAIHEQNALIKALEQRIINLENK